MLRKNLYFTATIYGADSDKIDFISYLNSLPEDWQFELLEAESNITYLPPDEETPE